MSNPRDNESDEPYEGQIIGQSQTQSSETLTGDNTLDTIDLGYTPPDREPTSFRGDTATETRDGETLDERLAEEVPDVSEADLDRVDQDERAGRLVAPDEGAHADEESDEIATDVGFSGYAASAEEAAMHVNDEDAAPAHLDGPASA